MPKKTLKAVLVACCCLLAMVAHAQPRGVLKMLGVESGLSSTHVNAIAQDTTGYLWVGTREGLNRFDGLKFKQYLSQGEVALPGEDITALQLIEGNRLLVGVSGVGVVVFFPEREAFSLLELPTGNRNRQMSQPRCFFAESDTSVLIGFSANARFDGGVVRLNTATLIAERVFDEVSNAWGLTQTNRGETWVAENEIHCFNYNGSGAYRQFDNDFRLARSVPYYQSIAASGDAVYFGTMGDGVHVFDRSQERVGEACMYVENDRKLIDNLVKAIFEPSEEGAWLVTADKGAGWWHRASCTVEFFDFGDVPMAMGGKSTRAMFRSRDGQLWFATNSGLGVFGSGQVRIEYVDLSAYSGPEAQRQWFHQIVEQGDRRIITTARSTRNLIVSANDYRVQSILEAHMGRDGRDRRINSALVFTDASDNVYFGGINKVHVLSPNAERLQEHSDLRSYYRSPYNAIMSMAVEPNGKVWLGSTDNQVTRLHQNGSIERSWWLVGDTSYALLKTDSLETSRFNAISSVVTDEQGGAFAWSDVGVFHVSERGVTLLLNEDNGFDPKQIGQLCYRNGLLALGGLNTGVYLYEASTGTLRHFNRASGLPSTSVHDLIFDRNDVVWGLGPNGIFTLNPAAQGTVSAWPKPLGMPYVDLSQHRLSVASTGEVFIGFRRGIGYFDPGGLIDTPLPERAVLQEVKVNNVEVFSINGRIEAEYGRSLEVSFAALGFIQPENYRYAWRLAGSGPWISLNNPTIFFASLAEGDFSLEFRAGNNSGKWLETTLKVDVAVHTPFLSSTLFGYLLAVLFVVLVLAGYMVSLWRLRAREQRNKAINRKLTDLELKVLRAQMNPHFLFNTMNSIKYFIVRNAPEEAAEYLTKFGRLIRQILINSTSDRIALSSELETLMLYIELEKLRFRKHFEVKVDLAADVEPDFVHVPPLLIQPFVENAIWHGLMHKEGEGYLTIALYLDEEVLVCTVEDNGVGRDAASNIRSKTATKEKSMGIDITQSRLERSLDGRSGSVEVHDLFDASGHACGTRVVLRIPVEL